MCTNACTIVACGINVFFRCYIKLGMVSLQGVSDLYWSGFLPSSCQFWMIGCVLQEWPASMFLPVAVNPRCIVLGCCITTSMIGLTIGWDTQ